MIRFTNKLIQPYTYLFKEPEFLLLHKWNNAFNFWLGAPPDKVKSIGEIVESAHNYFTLLDDIQDGSTLRRGIPVAHKVYGIGSTLTATNHVLMQTVQKTLALNHPKAVGIYIEQLQEINEGQGMEMHWRDKLTCPTEEEYKIMCEKKTGAAYVAPILLMQLFSNNKTDYTNFIKKLGIYFQIADDYCNLCYQEFTENKGFCEDLTEGKFSFPVIHAIKSRPEDMQVLNILSQRTADIELKKYCKSLLEKFGSLAYTREVIAQMESEAKKDIEQLGGNAELQAVLDEIKVM